ncbi:MAG TPA: metallophosphoesterase [Xanthobacteraceae bacterium]|jgi:predicted MPP superfamily phosphohydrolase
MGLLVNPRLGDAEDDASSTKQRSLLSLAGTLLSEISLPKLAAALMLMLVAPCLLLGLAPLIISAWIANIPGRFTSPYAGLWPILVLALLLAVGWFGGRALFRLAERSFWSLNSLVVEPCYAVTREGLRQAVEQFLPDRTTKRRRSRLRAITAAVAGIAICAVAILILMLAWPSSRWIGNASDLTAPLRLAPVALANGIVLVAAYLGGAALAWSIADATMAQPRDLDGFHPVPAGLRRWRVAHLSDLHIVGERYGFRIESGRLGPRGNERVKHVLRELDALHARNPLDAILVTGDMTDAGRSAEWAEFLDAMAFYPALGERILILPGNHDLNVVDRANPARLDLPTSPSKRLRQLRTLSAMDALQGQRVRVIDQTAARIGATLSEVLEPHRAQIAEFADSGRPFLSVTLANLWAKVFPLVVPPEKHDGLGIILLNSNAETHFSFTNALGLISSEQIKGMEIVIAEYPHACWLIALHHHPVEYPRPAKALSERIGTALINGSWFVRRLRPLAGHAVLMHGHRHVDWIGECAGLLIVSAPSPVMSAPDDLASYFYIQTFAVDQHGRLALLAPERISVEGISEAPEPRPYINA